MKLTLTAILLTALAAGLWQNHELSELKNREQALLAAMKQSRSAEASPEGVSASVSDRPDARKPMDPKVIVKKFLEMMERNRRPSDSERMELGDALANASPRELKSLVEEMRRNILPPEMKAGIFAAIAPRLAESYPELAAGIAVEGGERDGFQATIRTWLMSSPDAAAAWLKEEMKKNPPTPLRSIEGLNLDALALAARVIAGDPAGSGVAQLLAGSSEEREEALEIIVTSTTPDALANVMNRISQDPASPEKTRLDLIGRTLGRNQDPAIARQVLLDAKLPETQFIQTALVFMRNTDPSAMRTTVDWFLSATSGTPDRAAALEKIRLRWAARSPTDAEAYFREKNLPVSTP